MNVFSDDYKNSFGSNIDVVNLACAAFSTFKKQLNSEQQLQFLDLFGLLLQSVCKKYENEGSQ